MIKRRKFLQKTLWIVLCLSGWNMLESSSSQAAEIKEGKDQYHSITAFNRGSGETAGSVLIDGGLMNGMHDGEVLDVIRQARNVEAVKSDLWIKIGTVKIISLSDFYSVAKVVELKSSDSQSFFAKFPEIMVGDRLAYQPLRLVVKKLLSRSVDVAYASLFNDPKAYPASFELSEVGKQRLVEIVKQYQSLRVPALMIEAYTDDEGSEESNQVESYQRAQTVRQYLVEALGFDPNRLVAIGYGEAESADHNNVPGYQTRSRKIVFKVNSSVKSL